MIWCFATMSMWKFESTCEKKKNGQSHVVVKLWILYAHIFIHIPTKRITCQTIRFACDAILFLHVIIVIHMQMWTFYMWNFRGEKKKIAFEIVQFRHGIVLILCVKIVVRIWKKKANHLWGDPLHMWHYLISLCEKNCGPRLKNTRLHVMFLSSPAKTVHLRLVFWSLICIQIDNPWPWNYFHILRVCFANYAFTRNIQSRRLYHRVPEGLHLRSHVFIFRKQKLFG